MTVVTVATAVTVVTVVKKITQPLDKKAHATSRQFFFFYLLSQHFFKLQFYTFDTRCDVLRAAFCDSRNVLSCFVTLTHGSLKVHGGVPIGLCIFVAHI